MIYLAYTVWAVVFFVAVMGFGYFAMILMERVLLWNARRHARAMDYRDKVRASKAEWLRDELDDESRLYLSNLDRLDGLHRRK